MGKISAIEMGGPTKGVEPKPAFHNQQHNMYKMEGKNMAMQPRQVHEFK